MKKQSPDISIVIVCMNRWDNISECLDSLHDTDNVSCEIIVVAYRFSTENLQRLRLTYPNVTIIESIETRGFSENNNLALRQAKGRYCFVINDDTIIKPNCISTLFDSFSKLSDNVAIVSPLILNTDGSVQWCGRAKIGFKDYMLGLIGYRKESSRKSIHTNGNGLFKTYNISGAAFLIRTDLFKEAGFFDEHYFFCPEDIALSTKLNNTGYECFVNTNAQIIHKGGITTSGKRSNMQLATTPVEHKGAAYFLSNNNKSKRYFVSLAISIGCFLKATKYLITSLRNGKDDRLFAKANFLASKYMFSSKSAKEIFIECTERYIQPKI
mgnify:CR=1 FL=1